MPHRVCRTFARFDFILVPLPAARTTAKIGELSVMYPHHSNRSSIRRSRPPRLGRQDSNLRSRDQNPVPCHLATPQYRPAPIIPERLFAVRNYPRHKTLWPREGTGVAVDAVRLPRGSESSFSVYQLCERRFDALRGRISSRKGHRVAAFGSMAPATPSQHKLTGRRAAWIRT